MHLSLTKISQLELFNEIDLIFLSPFFQIAPLFLQHFHLLFQVVELELTGFRRGSNPIESDFDFLGFLDQRMVLLVGFEDLLGECAFRIVYCLLLALELMHVTLKLIHPRR